MANMSAVTVLLGSSGRTTKTSPNWRRISTKIALIALVFPAYKDGRAYSQARLLRERYGYRGELRATGQVLRDQFLFLLRAGFDSFDVVKEADAAAFGETAKRYSVFFQPTGDGRMTVARSRLSTSAKPARTRRVAA